MYSMRGLHRNLGTHISKVKSLKLDSWEKEQIRIMRVIGNTKANKVWEAHVPEAFQKPQHDSPMSAKQEWIQAKYELGLFKRTNQISDDEEGGEEEEEKDNLVWLEATSPDGRKYYWNKKTKERRWKKPDIGLPDNWRETTSPDGKKILLQHRNKRNILEETH